MVNRKSSRIDQFEPELLTSSDRFPFADITDKRIHSLGCVLPDVRRFEKRVFGFLADIRQLFCEFPLHNLRESLLLGLMAQQCVHLKITIRLIEPID
jgi:hypothetical protein